MVGTVCQFFGLLFFYSRSPRAQPFVKVAARAPPSSRTLWSQCHCSWSVADPKILNRGAEANLISAPYSFIAKKHNEIYVFTREKRLFGKKNMCQ